MEHGEIRQKLAAYLDSAVSQQEKEEIRAHLGRCGACRGEIADLELTVRMLKDLPEVEPPSWMADKIMAKIHDESGHKKGLLQRLFLPLWPKLPLEAFALVLVCSVSYYLVKNSGYGPPAEIAPKPVQHEPERPLPEKEGKESQPALRIPLRRGTSERRMETPMAEDTVKDEPALPAPPVRQEAAPLPAKPATKSKVMPELQPEEYGLAPGADTVPFSLGGKGVKPDPKRGQKFGSSELAGNASTQAFMRREEIALVVDDPASAAARIEDAVTHLGGSVSGHSYSGDRNLLVVKIRGDKISLLVEKLGRIGTIQGKTQIKSQGEAAVELTIKW